MQMKKRQDRTNFQPTRFRDHDICKFDVAVDDVRRVDFHQSGDKLCDVTVDFLKIRRKSEIEIGGETERK
jgi:hypothetical protein